MTKSDPAAPRPKPVQEWWIRVITGREPRLSDSLTRGALHLLAVPYCLGLKLNLGVYTARLKSQTQPALPVISIGNLSLGGTGKSTTVLYLARRLQEQGLVPAVVTRGYRRGSSNSVELVSAGRGLLLTPEQAGDEAAMLAQMLAGVPVAVGKRRERVIQLLRQQTAAQIVLLDDGFQYFRMRRALDIVLVDASRAKPQERLFPAGCLREPWTHLRRADQVWLTHADQVPLESRERLEQFLRRQAPGLAVVLTRHRLTGLRGPQGERCPPQDLAGVRVLAVSGLGNPESFEQTLRQAGAEVVPRRYPDHHPYSSRDLQVIAKEKATKQAELVIITENDAVKVNLADYPDLWVAECELEILRGEEQVETSLAQAVAELPDYEAKEE